MPTPDYFVVDQTVSIQKLMEAAEGLREQGEDDVNPEYDRGMCELIARVIQAPYETPEMALAVAEKIGIKRNLYG